MKKIAIKGFALSGFILSFFLIFSSVSCKKDTECTAIVTVIDSLGKPVTGATVRLFKKEEILSGGGVLPEGDVESIQTTDGSGNSTHKFKLEAILDIEAQKDTRSGIGIIRLKAGGTERDTVTIK